MGKHIYIFSLWILSVCLLAACQSLDEKLTEKAEMQEVPSSAYGITIEPAKEQYKVPVNKIVVAIKNDTTMDTGFGQSPTIEKRKEGAWYPVPIKTGGRVEAAGMVLMKNSEDKVSFSLDHLDEKLDPGQYRIVIPFSHEKRKSFRLAVPFEVTD